MADGVATILGTDFEDGTDGQAEERPHHFRRSTAIPVCPGNTIREAGKDAGCASAVAYCARAGQRGFRVWTFVGPLDDATVAPDEWIATGQKCIHTRDEAQPQPTMSQAEFRRLPIPAGKANVEPSWRPVLINVETNLYVDAAPVTLRATVLGRQVEVEAIPTRFRWSFSDGERFTTQDPGAPYPNMSTTHTFTTPGPASVTLTTIYTGRFRVVGETEWLPVSGTAEVASPAVPLEVIEARAVLVP